MRFPDFSPGFSGRDKSRTMNKRVKEPFCILAKGLISRKMETQWLLQMFPTSQSTFKVLIGISRPTKTQGTNIYYYTDRNESTIFIAGLNSVKIPNFHFEASNFHFWWKITKMITLVNSRILTNSPYIWISWLSWKWSFR